VGSNLVGQAVELMGAAASGKPIMVADPHQSFYVPAGRKIVISIAGIMAIIGIVASHLVFIRAADIRDRMDPMS